jgi:hypothetical protein
MNANQLLAARLSLKVARPGWKLTQKATNTINPPDKPKSSVKFKVMTAPDMAWDIGARPVQDNINKYCQLILKQAKLRQVFPNFANRAKDQQATLTVISCHSRKRIDMSWR